MNIPYEVSWRGSVIGYIPVLFYLVTMYKMCPGKPRTNNPRNNPNTNNPVYPRAVNMQK